MLLFSNVLSCFSLGLEVVLGVSDPSLPRTEPAVGRKALRRGGGREGTAPILLHATHLCGVWGFRGVGEQPGLPLSRCCCHERVVRASQWGKCISCFSLSLLGVERRQCLTRDARALLASVQHWDSDVTECTAGGCSPWKEQGASPVSELFSGL